MDVGTEGDVTTQSIIRHDSYLGPYATFNLFTYILTFKRVDIKEKRKIRHCVIMHPYRRGEIYLRYIYYVSLGLYFIPCNIRVT